MFKVFREFRKWKKFSQTKSNHSFLIFYFEGSWDIPHLLPIIRQMEPRIQKSVVLLTSEPLNLPQWAIKLPIFQIGTGILRTIIFRTLPSSIVTMTMPEIETSFLKRSVYPVHYVYVFHALHSVTLAYRKKSFDHYDSILCVGPHHAKEIRQDEIERSLPNKKLYNAGYVKFDELLSEYREFQSRLPTTTKKKYFLIAPSWGSSSLLESPQIFDFFENLIRMDYEVLLRLHPMTQRMKGRLMEKLIAFEKRHLGFKIITDLTETTSFFQSDHCLSDWSGAAFEFALIRELPVFFFSTQQKINDLSRDFIESKTLEASLREEIGIILPRLDQASLELAICEAACRNDEFHKKIKLIQSNKLFCFGHSAQVSARIIEKLIVEKEISNCGEIT
jgi:hypothetical protein